MGNSFLLLLILNKIDTSLYFITLEKVGISLPTKCLSDPTSGSVLIGDYRLSHAHFPECETINRNVNAVQSAPKDVQCRKGRCHSVGWYVFVISRWEFDFPLFRA